MKGNELLDKMTLVNPDYIEAAENVRHRKSRIVVRFCAAAAMIAIGIFAGSQAFRKGDTSAVNIGGIIREYKEVNVSELNSNILWPWEYKTIYEKFTSLNINGVEYSTRGRLINADLLGNELGEYEISGFDDYTDETKTDTATVFQIQGIDEKLMVAVLLGDEACVFAKSYYEPPAHLGEVLYNYSLSENLSLDRFSVNMDGMDEKYYSLADDSYIWDIISACVEAKFIEDYPDLTDSLPNNSISFTATSEALGVYKRVLKITADGYLWTNIFDHAYIFDIGEEKAMEIISYVKENGKEAQFEPYTNYLSGKIVDIKNGFIYVDDSILCKNEKDGIIFKIPMDDIRISRHIDFEGIGVGDIVRVSFDGDINNEYVVNGAYSISKATLLEGDIYVEE